MSTPFETNLLKRPRPPLGDQILRIQGYKLANMLELPLRFCNLEVMDLEPILLCNLDSITVPLFRILSFIKITNPSKLLPSILIPSNILKLLLFHINKQLACCHLNFAHKKSFLFFIIYQNNLPPLSVSSSSSSPRCRLDGIIFHFPSLPSFIPSLPLPCLLLR